MDIIKVKVGFMELTDNISKTVLDDKDLKIINYFFQELWNILIWRGNDDIQEDFKEIIGDEKLKEYTEYFKENIDDVGFNNDRIGMNKDIVHVLFYKINEVLGVLETID